MRELFRQKIVKTTKEHKCFGCEKVFPQGTRMLFQETSKHGTIQRIYLCEKCQKRLVAKEKKEMKMTDEQIEAALNACTFGQTKETRCKYCPLDSDKEPCITNLHLAALEYIGRLKHRADVAEKALDIACQTYDDICDNCYRKCYHMADGDSYCMEQAEKELAEEKDEI